MQPWVFLTHCIGNYIFLPIHASMHFIHTLGTMHETSVGEGYVIYIKKLLKNYKKIEIFFFFSLFIEKKIYKKDNTLTYFLKEI